MTDPDHAYLTTTGRRTGIEHTVELWYRIVDGDVWFLAGQVSDWVRNLSADPHVTVRIGDGDAFPGIAEVVEDGTAQPAREALAARYQGWRPGSPLGQWAMTATPVRVPRVTRRPQS